MKLQSTLVLTSAVISSLINQTFLNDINATGQGGDSSEAYTRSQSSVTNTHLSNQINISEQGDYIGDLTNVEVSPSINSTYTNNGKVAYQGSYIENEYLDVFITYSTLVISIFGIGGNILCLLIMLRPPVREMPHSIMCAALALADLLFLVVHLALPLAAILTGEPMQHLAWLNRPMCKFVMSLPYLCLHLDANIIVGLSIQRVICVFRPMHASQIITKFRIKLYLTVIFIFFILLNAESAIRYDWYEITEGNLVIKMCESMHFYGLPRKLWVIKDLLTALLSSFIPLIIISVCNVALLVKLARRQQMQAQLGVNTNQSEHARTNHTIIAIMVAFVVLLSPAYIYFMTVSQGNFTANDPIMRILALGAMVNPSINFLLYFLSSSMYRKAVKNLFKFQ